MARDPDIEIGASVKAKKLRFEHVDEVKVRFSGSPRPVSASGSSRKNLPEQVTENETYRDIEVDSSARASVPDE